jgi:hypothetical protein
MDIWGAVINADSQDREVVGVFSSEELALNTAKRGSPDAFDAVHYVLDKVPEWIPGFEQELAKQKADGA